MHRVPLIAATIALVALLVVGYLALNSRIARLEEALENAAPTNAAPVANDPSGEFSALGYDGTSALRLRLSKRLAAPDTDPSLAPSEPAAPAPATPDHAVESEAATGVRTALGNATEAALAQLARPGGYAGNPDVAIPLPQRLAAARSVLQEVGMSALMDDLRGRLNHAAELAAPDTRDALMRAIAELPLDDSTRLAQGDDPATSYLRSQMGERLARELRPLMAQRLEEVGAFGLYDQALGIYNSLPFAPPVDGDLTGYTTSRSLEAIFLCVSEAEQQFRSNRTARTTVALRSAHGVAHD